MESLGHKGDKRFGYSDSFKLLDDEATEYIRKLTENENTKIFRNKHILSYVVGLGFGAMSGAFSMVNVLADRQDWHFLSPLMLNVLQ